MKTEGLTPNQYKILEPMMEKWVNRNRYGRKPAPWRIVVNTIFWVLRTGAPWKDVPRNEYFAAPSTAHAWLGKMQEAGFLDEFVKTLVELAEDIGDIDAERLSVDGFFFQRTRRWRRSGLRVQRQGGNIPPAGRKAG
jgi:transposase